MAGALDVHPGLVHAHKLNAFEVSQAPEQHLEPVDKEYKAIITVSQLSFTNLLNKSHVISADKVPVHITHESK